MTKIEAIIHYSTSLFTFGKWLVQGLISGAEFKSPSTIMADKYNLPKNTYIACNACYYMIYE